MAGIGFLIQFGLGLTLLIFGLVARDTTFQFGSFFVLLGLLVWLGLIIIFNQHKLERLEALEEDELAASRPDAESAFDRAGEDVRVAARRLRLMHKWLMPAFSLVVAAGLASMAWLMLRHMKAVGETELLFHRTEHVGWAVAICLAFAALSFIVSRFVAGMAEQPVWQNLRGGAAYMVGNSLVALAVAVGMGFCFFNKKDPDLVIRWVATGIPWFMIALALEFVFNFVLNLYRPRIVGEMPRPAFDSKALSMFAAPDSLVKSINEAVNYQFGFDVTSSWGYQLLLRSFAWLVVLGIAVIILLNTMVIVEPNQQAVKLSRGALVGDVYSSGILWKLPWPAQTAERYPVTTIRKLHLTARHVRDDLQGVQLWTDDLEKEFDRKPDPFVVGSAPLSAEDSPGAAGATDGAADGEKGLVRLLSLVDAEIVLQYRIREDGGLPDYLHFSSDVVPRRKNQTVREEVLRSLALREVTRYFTGLSLDEVLARNRSDLGSTLRDRVQAVFDEHKTGVEVVSVALPLLRPAGEAAGHFEEFSVSYHARRQTVAVAEGEVVRGYAVWVGDPANVEPILRGIEEYNRLRDEFGAEATETLEQRVKVEQMVVSSGGRAAQLIMGAERDRWLRLMEARGRSSRVQGQLLSYQAAPELYMQREIMRVYKDGLEGLRKYVIGIPSSRVLFDIDVKELTGFVFQDSLEEGESGQ